MEITGVDKNGNFITKEGKSVKDIQEAIDGGAAINYQLSTTAGKQGLIVTVDGTDYFIPKSQFGSASKEAWSALENAERNKFDYDQGMMQLKLAISNKYAKQGVQLSPVELEYLAAIEAANQPYLQNLQSAIKDWGSKYTSEQGFGIFGKYAIPTVKLINEGN